MAVQFSDTQQKIIDARGKNMLVSASAGSGKTTVLVERLISQVIKDRIPVSDILAMTFTEDAAGEMIARLRKRLQAEDTSDPYIRNQLTLLETASISTIHGFCLNVVQKHYYRLNLPYSMVQTIDNDILDSQARQKAYERTLQDIHPDDYAALKVYMESCGQSEDKIQENLLRFLEIASSKPDPLKWMEQSLNPDGKTQDWFLQFFRLRIDALLEIFEEMEQNVAAMTFTSRTQSQEEWIHLFSVKANWMRDCLRLLDEKNYPAFRTCFLQYISETGKFTPTINKQSFKVLCEDYKSLQSEIAANLFTPEQFEQSEDLTRPLKKTFVTMAMMMLQYFRDEKRKMNFIDFSDMEQLAYELLSIDEVAREYRDQFQVVLIDEYQDTNDLQEAIIRKVSRKNNVFRVGDLKQSIYGFRQAKPALMRSLMEQKDENSEVFYMDENYRSKSSIIDFNNRMFSTLMNIDGMQPQFAGEDAARPGTDEQNAMPQKPVRFLYSQYDPAADPDEEAAAADGKKESLVVLRSRQKKNRIDWIAQDIEKKIKEGYSYRDIAILSRTSTSHQEMKNALEAWGIPSIARMRQGFYTNQAIQIVLSALKIIRNPRDDVALMSVLCSPLGKQKQSTVVKASLQRNEGQSLYDALRFHPMMKFYDEFASWNSLPLSEILLKIYSWNNFYYNFTTRQDKTNLDLLLERAARSQSEMDLEEFLNQATLESDFNNIGEAVPFGREDDVVKISTIHASKGLQYKVVYILSEERDTDKGSSDPILIDPDLGLSLLSLSPDHRVKKETLPRIAFRTKRFMEDQEEKMRLLYVAATRAENELTFVDTVKNLQEYDYPLGPRTLLARKGFTGWLLYASNTPGSRIPLELQEVDSPVVRPEEKKKPYYRNQLPLYTREVPVITSATASGAKKNHRWRPVSFSASAGMQRGTLFHEMASRLPYPYKKEDFADYVSRYGYLPNELDERQFLSLNGCTEFARWMNGKHQFELPYSVFEDGAYVHGFMDFVAFDGNTIHIVDFKSDIAFDMETLKRQYAKQLKTYEKAMKEIYPGYDVKTWLYSFTLGEISSYQDVI